MSDEEVSVEVVADGAAAVFRGGGELVSMRASDGSVVATRDENTAGWIVAAERIRDSALERAQSILVDAQAEIERLAEEATGDDRAALADAALQCAEAAELLEVQRTGRLRAGFSIPMGYRQEDRSGRGRDAAASKAAASFARLLKRRDR